MKNNEAYNGLSDRRLKVLIILVAVLIGWMCFRGQPFRARQTAPATVSPNLQEVIKLTKAHMTDDVILAFIHNSGAAYNLSADDVLYLNGQGVSQPVISALIQSKATAPLPAPAPSYQAPTPAPTYPAGCQQSFSTPPYQVNPPGEPGTPAPQISEGSAPPLRGIGSDAAVFSKPIVALRNMGGHPRQRALLDSFGASDHAGLASVFHGRPLGIHGARVVLALGLSVGRLCIPLRALVSRSRYGWAWVPGYHWGPGWVCWRNAEDAGFCGWAPLPPSARFEVGVGLVWNGGVAVDTDFGLGADMFVFLPFDHFWDHDYRVCGRPALASRGSVSP